MADKKTIIQELEDKITQLEQKRGVEKGSEAGQVVKTHKIDIKLDQPVDVEGISGEIATSTDAILKKLKVLDDLLQEFKDFYIDFPKEISVSNLKEVPTRGEVRVSNLKELPVPDMSKLDAIPGLLKEIRVALPKLDLPKDAKDPIAVRLSDGEKFYKALDQIVQYATGGGGGSPTVHTTSGVRSVPVVNPDGSSVGSVASIASVAIAESATGDHTIVAAQTGKSIYVFAWNISYNGAVNIKFTDGASGAALTGLFYGVANAGGGNAVTPPSYLFNTSASTALVLNLSGNVAVGGIVSYYVQ